MRSLGLLKHQRASCIWLCFLVIPQALAMNFRLTVFYHSHYFLSRFLSYFPHVFPLLSEGFFTKSFVVQLHDMAWLVILFGIFLILVNYLLSIFFFFFFYTSMGSIAFQHYSYSRALDPPKMPCILMMVHLLDLNNLHIFGISESQNALIQSPLFTLSSSWSSPSSSPYPTYLSSLLWVVFPYFLHIYFRSNFSNGHVIWEV